MLINRFRHLVLLGILVTPRLGELTNSTTFRNDSLVRSEREIGINYLTFPQGSNVQVRYKFSFYIHILHILQGKEYSRRNGNYGRLFSRQVREFAMYKLGKC